MEYNYARFDPSHIDLTRFSGPRAGEAAVEFTAHTLAGGKVRLSDYRGRWVVLETGSLTCPMYARNVETFQGLSSRFPDVEFLLLYVREAHPGSRTGPHRNLGEKIGCARRLKVLYGERRGILVDDIDGGVHLGYGGLPNFLYVIDPGGRVVYRSDWTEAKELEEVLNRRGEIRRNEHNEPGLIAPWPAVRVLLRGGWNALWDIVISLPRLVLNHLQAHRTRRREEGPE